MKISLAFFAFILAAGCGRPEANLTITATYRGTLTGGWCLAVVGGEDQQLVFHKWHDDDLTGAAWLEGVQNTIRVREGAVNVHVWLTNSDTAKSACQSIVKAADIAIPSGVPQATQQVTLHDGDNSLDLALQAP